MWPVDYILNSVYSPLRLEQQLPNHHWRDAFEDLLALESNGEMISLESRKQETEIGVKILHGKASHFIFRINRNLRQLSLGQTLLQESRKQAMLNGNRTIVSAIDNEALPLIKSLVDKEINNSGVVKEAVETQKHFPASRLKQRGQWIASLVSSGVLPGWKSRLEGGPTPGQQRILIRKWTEPSGKSDQQGDIVFTENDLQRRFGEAESPEIMGPSVEIDAFGLRSDEVVTRITISEEELGGESSSEASPPRHYLTAQTTTSERILLPDGSTVNKVVLTNHSGNGKDESIEIIQDAGKVLEGVEKARMLMQHETDHWWIEYRRT